MCTNEKLNLLLINSIYLVFSLPEMQRRLIQISTSFFNLSEKKTFQKPSKIGSCKNSFPCLYVIGTVRYDECFLFHMVMEDIIFYTNLPLPRGFLQVQCCCVL